MLLIAMSRGLDLILQSLLVRLWALVMIARARVVSVVVMPAMMVMTVMIVTLVAVAVVLLIV